MGKKITYRDLIYFNTDKVQSILAQINKGIIESMIETKQTTHDAEGGVKTSKILEILGFPISGEGKYKFTHSKSLQEEKSLHDFALTNLLKMLPYKDVSNLDRDLLSQNNDRTFVKVKGEVSVYDYEHLSENIEKIDTITRLFNGDDTKSANDLIDFSNFVKTAYAGLTTAEIKNRKGINFIGAIETEFLRETTRNMIYKYGTKPKGEWEMICQITSVPKNNSLTIEDTFENFGKDIQFNPKEKSMGNFMNELVKEFSTINDLFASVSYPNIAVEPIAIYKEILLK